MPRQRHPLWMWSKGRARHPLMSKVRPPWIPSLPRLRGRGKASASVRCHTASWWMLPDPPPRTASPQPAVREPWQLIVHRRSWHRVARQAPPPAPWRPVLADLVGGCFVCLWTDHVAAHCSCAPRCLRYHREGHQARVCMWPRSPNAAGTPPHH
jgi:hypothetical protein